MKRLVATALFAVAMAAAGAGYAGSKQVQQVVIVDASKLANGDLGYVRNTPDTVQYISCTNSGTTATCNARNAGGVSRSCSTTDPAMLATIRSLPSDGYLVFYWDVNGNCTSVNVTTTSRTAPKQP
jgi:hypothetical protein